jgi:hypothetical protein
LLPRRRACAKSAAFAPASCSRNTPIICSSVNLFRFIGPSFRGPESNFIWRKSAGAGHKKDHDWLDDLTAQRAYQFAAENGYDLGDYVDAVAENVVVVDDDVADMDADTKFDALGFGHAAIAVGHPTLNLGSAANRMHRAGESDQHAIAGRLDDTAPVLGNLRVDKRSPAFLQPCQRTLFIPAHKAAIAGNINREHGRKTSLNPGRNHIFCSIS